MDIKLHKNDLPDDLNLGNLIAVDGEFMGLNIRRDPLCLIQISSGNSDAHIIQLDRMNYKAPNLINVLQNDKITKIFHYGRADLAFIKYYDRLPDLKEIVKAPLQAPMVEQGQLAFVLTCELVKVVKHKREAFDSCVQYIERMYKEHNSAELVALFIKDCLSNDGTLKTHAKTRELFGSNSPFAHLLN
mgnify:FL=1